MNNNYCEYCGERNQDLFDYKTYIGNIEHYCPRCYIYVNFHYFIKNLERDIFLRFIMSYIYNINDDVKCNNCVYNYNIMGYKQFIEKMEKEVNSKIEEKVDIVTVMEQYFIDGNNEEETGKIVIYPPDDYH